MTRLVDLDAQFMRWERRDDGKIYWVPVATLAEAHGVKFLCPKCFVENGGPRGTHAIMCWSRSAGAPEEATPLPGRWKMDGLNLDDLTLNADPPSGARSVLLHGGCAWHGFVTNGDAA